ncbi:MAG TPA: sulfate adenylyltransferase subunit CysN [Beijerinckiaceae bacterium]|nr:sulfate adenylyltransferase subunit CysN [Beijerinckiaceae bacterium]
MTLALVEDVLVEPARSPSAAAQPASLLRFITCGSVDDGKSTLIGRLLYDSKSVFDDQLETLDKDSRRFGTQGAALDLALLVDGLSAEREQGITIDVAYRYFATSRRSFIVADTPGHEQYTRNMATGASTADLAIILIDARKGILPQTRRHSFIVSMLGVRHVAVAVNKMDLVGYDRAVYDRIVSVYKTMAAELGFAKIDFFPISALKGDNVVKRSASTPWRHGGSLLEFLETVEIETSPTSEGLLFPVQWVNRPDHQFRGYAGWVAAGRVRRGQEIIVLPRGLRSRVERIVTFDGDPEIAAQGQSVTLALADEIDVSRGDLIAALDTDINMGRRLTARLLWTGEQPLSAEASYLIKIGAALAQARVAIEHTIDVHSFAPEPSASLTMNGIALAALTLDRTIVAPSYRQSRDLGGFILIDKQTNETVAFGLVEPPAPASVGRRPAGDAYWRLYARAAVRFFTGRETTRASLAADLTGFGAGSLASALLVFVLTGNIAISIVFLIANALLYPAVRRACGAIFAARAKAAADELNSDGAGI